MARKKTEPKHITHTLNINGDELVFKFTKCPDGRLYYRPTLTELDLNPRLKPMKRKRLSDLLDGILSAFEADDPKITAKKLFNDELLNYIRATKRDGTNPNKPSTYANVEFTITHYIMPYFEGMLIKDVDDSACRDMLSALLKKGYSKSIIDKAYLYTNEFLQYLTYKLIIPYNPMMLVQKPKPEKIATAREKVGKKEKQRHYLEDSEIEKLRQLIYNGYDFIQPAIIKEGKVRRKEFTQHKDFEQPEVFDFLLNTGLRTGELLALKYENWDESNGIIDIKAARVTYIQRDDEGKGTLVTEELDPKNSTSKTKLKLTVRANEILKILKSKENANYAGYIVHNKKFEPITVRAFEARLERVLKQLHLLDDEGNEIRISPHDFRHTFASVLWEKTNGDLIYIKEKLRHKDATTTANIYTDLRKKQEEEID